MSLEGSLVLPIFLFFIMTLLLGIEAVRFWSDMSQALYEAGNRYAAESFQVKYRGKEFTDTASGIRDYLDEQFLPYFGVDGGSAGITFQNRSVTEEGRIELVSEYRLASFIFWLPIGDIVMEDKFLGHTWTGYSGREEGWSEKGKEIYVYVTKTGSKYHLTAECSSLKVNATAVDASWLAEGRNKWGGKYYPCEKCKPKEQGTVYITSDGNSYHNSGDCSALKRIIYIIPLSEADGYTPCSRCGG